MTKFISFPNDISVLISHLHTDTKPLWGIMSAQHVVEHLILVTNLSIGNIEIPITIVTPSEKLPKYKESLMGDYPFPHEFKAPFLPQDALVPLQYPDLVAAKHALFEAVEGFFAYYEENPNAFHIHPVFGNCNFIEWKRFHTKHFSHHFEQFGLLN